MRTAVLFLILVVNLHGQEIKINDLGVVSPHRGIVLVRDTNQVDFVLFKIELIPERWTFNTNAVVFTTTNEVLTLSDFMAMPPGPCLVGIRAVYSDGDESNVSLNRVHVRRDSPKPPSAHGIGLLNTNLLNRQSTTNLLWHRFHSRTNQQSMATPPLPPGLMRLQTRESPIVPVPKPEVSRETVRAMAMAMETINILTNTMVLAAPPVEFPGPLPGGSPKTYSDHMVEMHDFMTRRGRRSE